MSLDLKMENSKRTRAKLEDVTGLIASDNNWLGYSMDSNRIKWLGVDSQNQQVSCEEGLPYKGTGLVQATFQFLNSLS